MSQPKVYVCDENGLLYFYTPKEKDPNDDLNESDYDV